MPRRSTSIIRYRPLQSSRKVAMQLPLQSSKRQAQPTKWHQKQSMHRSHFPREHISWSGHHTQQAEHSDHKPTTPSN
eukprot:6471429-Amphidinium_carterae.1